jgi:hypothetical protein
MSLYDKHKIDKNISKEWIIIMTFFIIFSAENSVFETGV